MTALESQIAMLADRATRWYWWFLARTLTAILVVAMMAHHRWKHVFDDLNVYSSWGQMLAAGQVPSADPRWQYPPLAAFVFAAIGHIGSAPWLFAVFFAGIDIAISMALMAHARTVGRWDGVAVWIIAPLLLGPVLYGRYDGVPTLVAILGVLAVASPVRSGAILGLGGGFKVWPGVLLLALTRRDTLRGGFAAGVAVVTTMVVTIVTFPTIISGFLGNGRARGLQTEAVAALPLVWARLAGASVPDKFRYGSSEILIPGADFLGRWLPVMTAVGLAALITARILGLLDRSPVADIALVVVMWLMITSRVLSPQYNVWLVGMAALVCAAGSRPMRRAVLWIAMTAVAGQWLYPFAYRDIIDGGFVGVAIQTVRVGALVAAFIVAVRVLAAAQRTSPVAVAVPGQRVSVGAASH